MNLWESISISLEGLVANKMRSMLTMLGVIIGVAAVIAMLSIANGARRQMMGRIQQMGTNILMVQSGQSHNGPVRGGEGSSQSLNMEDADAIIAKCPSVAKVSPEVRSNAQVKYANKNTNTSIIGAVPDYLSVHNFTMQEGRFINARDLKAMSKIAVIGPTTASNLFGDASPVGKMIYIKGTQFQVIGTTATKGAQGMQDLDDQIYIPISTSMRRLFGIKNIRMITIEAASMALMDQASDEISKLLRKRHKLAADADDDFNIRNQADFMELANQAASIFTTLLAGIASVSLLVGGIGIMNIMLVSVTERTREIGLRKALGARRRDIQMQFLVEALVLSLLGGFVGIFLGVGASCAIASLFKWPTSITIQPIAMSFCFAAFVGIFFGYYPARKASMLDPIDALRYE